MPKIESQLFKLKDAAAYLGVGPMTVRRLVLKGRLRRHPAFRHVLVTKTSLDKFLAEAD